MTSGTSPATYQPLLDPQGGVAGVRCVSCRRAIAPATPRCPACGADVTAERFAPTGVVWASTVIHIPVGERRPPYGLAYVDLDDGPRVLALQRDPSVLAPGRRVRLEATSEPAAWCVAVPAESGTTP